MKIVVEGMDNTGKSTLCKKLSVLGFDYNHSEGPRTPEAMYRDTLAFLNKEGMFIQDRIPVISDQVYGPILRGTNAFHTPLGSEVERVYFQDSDILHIFCFPPKDKVVLFEDGRRQMNGVQENAGVLYELYRKFYEDLKSGRKKTRSALVEYDYTTDTFVWPDGAQYSMVEFIHRLSSIVVRNTGSQSILKSILSILEGCNG